MLLYFCCLFYLLTISGVSFCQNIFVTTKGCDVVCVTNSSSGLSWNSEIENKSDVNYVSQYIPNPSTSFDCDIKEYDMQTKNYYEIKPWTLKTKISNEIILDRRWEEMKIFSTTTRQEYVPVRNLGPNFDIPMSIRTKRAAYIYLCNGPDPPRSTCLLFVLKEFEMNVSSVKKCRQDNEQLDATNAPICVDLLHKNVSYNLLDENYWTHFTLSKKGNDTSLKNAKGEIILELRHNVSDNSHMLVQSRSAPGLWKIHEIDYIYTEKETNDTRLGPPIDIKDNFTCISMLVSMCESCQLKLKLKSDNLLLKEETYQPQNNQKKWFEIKFTVENIVVDSAHLFVSTIGRNKSGDFWKIDKVRLCQKREFRVIKTDREAECQLVEDYTLVSSANSEPKIESTCPENTVGTFCVPCHWIYPSHNCDKIRVCTEYKLGRTACWCSAGLTNLPRCQDACAEGRYGLSCNKTCGNCSSRNLKCDAKNGTYLSTCVKNYVGPQCDRIEVSAPYDIELKWSSNNELLLKWKILHALESKLNRFNILVSKCRDYTCKKTDTVFRDKMSVKTVTSNFIYRKKVNFPIEPSTYYMVTLYSNNSYSTKSNYVTDLSPPELPNMYKEVKLTPTDSTITIELETSAKNLTVLISDDSGNLYAHPELEIFGYIVTNFSKYRTVVAQMDCEKKCAFVIGSGPLGTQNPPLIPNTSYNITYILSTTNRNKTSHRIYYTTCSSTYNRLVLLSLLVLLLIPLVSAFFLCKKKRKQGISKFIPRQLKSKTEENNPGIQQHTSVELKPSKSSQKRKTTRKTKNVNSYLNPVSPSKVISVKNFQTYVKQAESDGELNEQFKAISSAKKIYDEVEGNHFFHYIDMTFVNGNVIPKAFLVTEVPKLSETHHFWRNIFEGNVKHIVVLNSRENSKCFQYWPQVNEKLEYDNISIQLFSQQNFLHYEVRRFILVHNEMKRYVNHISFYYSGTDPKSYVSFFKKLSEYAINPNSSILIHTSDSVSRIGFVLLCDMSIRMAREESVVDVLSNFKRLSDQVAYLVDDLHLYKLSYMVISEYIFGAELASNLTRVYNNLK
ncbi:uncharacterized protein LOC135133665 isoform X2 [Zophobas morio]|uniref:uncharacterized protein LOC135133665 isoform X2 n=1 Tax=Zophobas morio TaxID=2755281 RepID=UPI003083D16C